MIALRPYDGVTAADNQNLVANVTNANDVLAPGGNNFSYNGNGGLNELAYKIYSNQTYKVSMQANPTNSQDELNNYITFTTVTLPSPQNGQAPYTAYNNGDDHIIDAAANTRLIDATASAMQLLHNSAASTGATHPPAIGYDPNNTDFAAFAVRFAVHPGFSVFPGNYTTSLTVTATTP